MPTLTFAGDQLLSVLYRRPVLCCGNALPMVVALTLVVSLLGKIQKDPVVSLFGKMQKDPFVQYCASGFLDMYVVPM